MPQLPSSALHPFFSGMLQANSKSLVVDDARMSRTTVHLVPCQDTHPASHPRLLPNSRWCFSCRRRDDSAQPSCSRHRCGAGGRLVDQGDEPRALTLDVARDRRLRPYRHGPRQGLFGGSILIVLVLSPCRACLLRSAATSLLGQRLFDRQIFSRAQQHSAMPVRPPIFHNSGTNHL